MQVTTSIREDDGKTQVTVVVPAEEVKKHVDAYYKSLGKHRIPGFRPGKAPRKILDQNFGGREAILNEVASDMINQIAPVAVDGEDILFITDPDFDEFDPIEEGSSFSFTLHGKVKPDMELITYDPIEITLPSSEVTEAEIDSQLNGLREYYYSFETLEDGEVKNGDFVLASLECTSADQEIQGLNSDNRLLQVGEGLMPEEFDAALLGMKPGETKEFDFTTGGVEDFAYMGEGPIHAKITIAEIRQKVLPEIDEEFASKAGFDSVEALRAKVTEAIQKQKDDAIPRIKENRCVEELGRRLHGEAPVAYVNFSRSNLLKDFFGSLQNSGKTFDQFLAEQGITSEDFQKDLEQEAKEVAEQTLALDALFKHLGLEVTDEDIDNEFQVVEDPEATRKEWEQAGRMALVREGCRRAKATEWLVENAIVTVESDDATDEKPAKKPAAKKASTKKTSAKKAEKKEGEEE